MCALNNQTQQSAEYSAEKFISLFDKSSTKLRKISEFKISEFIFGLTSKTLVFRNTIDRILRHTYPQTYKTHVPSKL